MAQVMIACPLCSALSFSNMNSLCLSLVSIASKKLRCTICEEELNGLDKFTLHLLSHFVHNSDLKEVLVSDLSTHKSDSTIETNKITEPLNLVKGVGVIQQSMQKIENIASNTFCAPAQKTINTHVHENNRPNLKIDNEVMIFFNSSDRTSNKIGNESNANLMEDVNLLSTKIYENSPQINPQLGNKNDKVAIDEVDYVVSDKHSLSSKQQENHYPNPAKLLNSSCIETSVPHVPNSLEMSVFNMQGNCKKRQLEAVEQTKLNSEPDWSVMSTSNSSSMKSSFLSPKGERILGFRCDICSLVFPDEHIMTMHRQLIHIEINGDSLKTNRFKCHLCSKSFAMRGSLMVHMRVAHFGGAVVARLVESKQLESNVVSPDSAQFICSICNKGFKKEHQLSQHEKLHDGKQCDVCFKTFTTKYFLRKHKRLHTGEMPYTCNICNKSFTFQQSYHKHLLYHSDDKPYSCAECGRAFKELSTLHNHQRIHTGEKPFSCESCGKCFRQRVSYLVHRRIHTGIMPYKCQECGKTFRYKVSERTHKCTLSNSSPITESTETTGACESNENAVCTDLLSECFQNLHNSTKENVGMNKHNGTATVANTTDDIMSENYPEPADFFSLVMSPADRLQHLSLSGEEADGNPTQDSIDSEALKQLLYDVADYT